MNGLKIGIYCRVSSREQAIYGYGIDVQKNKIRDYIKLFEIDHSVIKYYIDEGISAKNLNRDGIKSLINDVEDNKIDVVYIYKLDRLSRSVTDVYNMIEMFTKQKCNLVAIMDNIDVNSANGRLFVWILAIIAQWERETIMERTRDGVQEMVNQGKWPYGSKPYGYNKTDELKLVFNDLEVIYIKFINRKAREGITIKEIENLIMEKFNIVITADRIKDIIKKEWYYGQFTFHGQIYDNICPAIYSEADAIGAQQMISKRFKQYDDNRYYFKNKIRCTCGEILENKSTKKRNNIYYFYYVCPHCKKRINQNIIIDQTLYSISATTSMQETKSNNVRALRKLNTLNRKIQTLHDKYINDQLDLTVYMMSMYKFEYEKKQQIAKIKTEKLIDFMRWAEMGDMERKQFITNHIKGIIVDTKANIVISIEYLQK